ncbi:MAG: MotA/TolQ/ExbB proton channel family protein, partial [Burkholderiaceae bacterium]
MWPLILASILALALIIERAIALQRSKIVPATLLTDVLGIWKKRQVTPEVIAKLEANSPLGRVLAAGLRNERATRDGAMQQVEAAGSV